MQLFLCTISFRHQLMSIDQLVKWARTNHFQGIELWGVHANNLADQPQYDKDWLAGHGLRATMISDYLPLYTSEQNLFNATQKLSRLCNHWGCQKIRTFSGAKPSAETTEEERKQLFSRLQMICDWLAEFELNLVIETHPNTYADSLASTEHLLAHVNRNNLKINFDVVHVWESKVDITTALERLAPHIQHFHLKNVRSEEQLSVFAPDNVYAPAGTRDGMAPLFDGVVDYAMFFHTLFSRPELNLVSIDASLEWFGHQSQSVLQHDRNLIQRLEQQYLDRELPAAIL
jgi:3-dehydroshikimate dehydratase